jgi:hypothetical protein
VTFLNLAKGLSILSLVGEALPADWAGPCDIIFLFASWRHNNTKESRYLGHGGMERTYTGSGVQFGGDCVTVEALQQPCEYEPHQMMTR